MEPTEESSSNFLPVDWTSGKSTIKLVPGAVLQEEKLLLGPSMYKLPHQQLTRASTDEELGCFDLQ